MANQGEHKNNKAQVPLAALAKRDDDQRRTNHMHRDFNTNEQDIPKSNMDQQVNTRGSLRLRYPHQEQIEEKAQRLVAEQLREFQRIGTTNDTLRRNVANMNRSPFTEEIEQTEP
ncbi:hypothetical protein ACFX16_003276 [Malus domestica]